MQPACKEGLRRLGCLQQLHWARQLQGLALWPTAFHLNLLDRKFAGPLTRADTLGMDAEQCDEAEGEEHEPQLPILSPFSAKESPQRLLGGAGTMSNARRYCTAYHVLSSGALVISASLYVSAYGTLASAVGMTQSGRPVAPYLWCRSRVVISEISGLAMCCQWRIWVVQALSSCISKGGEEKIQAVDTAPGRHAERGL